MLDKGIEESMRPKYAICILFTAAALLVVSGCIAQEKSTSIMGNSIALMKYLPQNASLPQGFKEVMMENDVLNDPQKNIFKTNLTNYIEDKGFLRPKEIGSVNATLARYKQTENQDDAIVALIALKDEEHAQAAVSNYLSNYRLDHVKELQANVTLINPATINKHDVMEIREYHSDGRKYLYLWNNKTTTVWVLGNSSKEASMRLASATGL